MSRSLKYILATLFALVMLAIAVFVIWGFSADQDFAKVNDALPFFKEDASSTGVSKAYMRDATEEFARVSEESLEVYQAAMPGFEAWAAEQRLSIPKNKTKSKEFMKLIQEQADFKKMMATLQGVVAVTEQYPLYFKELEHRGGELPEPFASKDKALSNYAEPFGALRLELLSLAQRNDSKEGE